MMACGSLMICLPAVSLIFSPTTVALSGLSALSWTCPTWPCLKSFLHVIFSAWDDLLPKVHMTSKNISLRSCSVVTSSMKSS